MIESRLDDLLENVDSRYALVIVAAKRARQINNYHHQLGEGSFGDNLPPLVAAAGDRVLPRAPKSEIAVLILDEVEMLLGDG